MCYASAGDSPLSFHWSHNDRSVDALNSASSGVSIFKAGPRTSILSIDHLQARHSGTYVCRADNAAGGALSSDHLNIQGPQPQSDQFKSNQNSPTTPKLLLFPLLSSSAVGGDWFLFEFKISKFPLEISKTKARRNFINVRWLERDSVSPSINPFDFEEEVFAGTDVQLNCYVSRGDRPLTIWWTRNDVRLNDESSAGVGVINVGAKTSLLTLTNVNHHSDGQYRCWAENPAGLTSHSANLTVYGKKERIHKGKNKPPNPLMLLLLTPSPPRPSSLKNHWLPMNLYSFIDSWVKRLSKRYLLKW